MITCLTTEQLELAQCIKEYMFANLHEKINDEVLTKKFPVTSHFLQNLFPLAFENKTPAELLKEQRMKKVVHLLLSNERHSRKYIALSTGFSNHNTLNRAFLDYYQMTINDYLQYIQKIKIH